MLATILEIIKESFFVFFSSVIGIYLFGKLNAFYRLQLAQVIVYSIVYICIRVTTQFNNFIYNVATLIEITILMLAAHVYFRNRLMRFFLLSLYTCALAVYIFQIKLNGIFLFAYFGYVAGGIAVAIAYIFILYNSFMSVLTVPEKKAGICLSLGLIIYFACSVPSHCLIGYLNVHMTKRGLLLFNLLNDSAANIRYFLTAYTFWCLRKTLKKTNITST